MATLQEQVGMRLGITLSDTTIPSKSQVDEFLKEGLHRVSSFLTPEELWPLSKSKVLDMPAGGFDLSSFADAQNGVDGYAQILDVHRKDAGGKYQRCTEIPTREYHKATNNPNSMYAGTEAYPVFTYRDGKIIVLPAPATGSNDGVEINYVSAIEINSDDSVISKVPPRVQSVVINYATGVAAQVLAAYYAQDEDPIARLVAQIGETSMIAYKEGIATLQKHFKLRGNIS